MNIWGWPGRGVGTEVVVNGKSYTCFCNDAGVEAYRHGYSEIGRFGYAYDNLEQRDVMSMVHTMLIAVVADAHMANPEEVRDTWNDMMAERGAQ